MKTTTLVAALCVLAAAGASAALMDKATPESQGVPSSAIVRWIDACEREIGPNHSLHGFVIVRHGKVIAEGCWAPYSADVPHALYSISKAFTSMAIGYAVDRQ